MERSNLPIIKQSDYAITMIPKIAEFDRIFKIFCGLKNSLRKIVVINKVKRTSIHIRYSSNNLNHMIFLFFKLLVA